MSIVETAAQSIGCTMKIQRGGLDDPRVRELLETHLNQARIETAPGSNHALDVKRLKDSAVEFWSMWENGDLAAIGAVQRLSSDHYEIKSMHTIRNKRRGGIGSRMLLHIIDFARVEGAKRLSLETGSWEYFRPAHALYSKYGFVECEPFADYVLDPNSVFMTLDLNSRPSNEILNSHNC